MTFLEMYIETDCPKDLCQGDIFLDQEGKIIPLSASSPVIAYMVLSYTCDLQHGNVNFINVCAILKLRTIANWYAKEEMDKQKKRDEMKKKKGKKTATPEDVISSKLIPIIKQESKKYFFLPPRVEFDNEPAIADIGWISSIQFTFKKDLSDRRICSLKSPWREKLAYKLSNMFGRVALKNEEAVLVTETAKKLASDAIKATTRIEPIEAKLAEPEA